MTNRKKRYPASEFFCASTPGIASLVKRRYVSALMPWRRRSTNVCPAPPRNASGGRIPGPPPTLIDHQLATLVWKDVPADAQWIREITFDGCRTYSGSKTLKLAGTRATGKDGTETLLTLQLPGYLTGDCRAGWRGIVFRAAGAATSDRANAPNSQSVSRTAL